MKAATAKNAKCENCNIQLPTGSQFCPSCGQSASEAVPGPVLNTLGAQPTMLPTEMPIQSTKEFEPGERFADRYQIERLLGKGGMGTVYLAKDELSENQVAIKILNSGHFSDSDARRLIDEGMLARDIRHPNVVAVYDADSFQNQAYLTMEFIPGITLREWIRNKHAEGECCSLVDAVQMISQILDGLEAAHRKQVVHRDLKPENIMVIADDRNGWTVKILDFGIAKHETQSRNSGSTAGTLGYMSPEQFTSADLVGPSSDLYSVSVIFYELLVGTLPRGHWQPPSQGRQDIPEGIDELIEKGLSNRASSRPQTANDFRSSIMDATNRTPSSQNSVSQLGQTNENFWIQKWNSGAYTEWWNSLTFQAKAWTVTVVIIVLGIVGAALEELSSDEDGYDNGYNQESVSQPMYPDAGPDSSPW